jgi:homoserine kinase
MGPFFDSFGYCLNHLGDFVEAQRTKVHKRFLLTDVLGPYAEELREADVPIEKNCVQFVADTIQQRFDLDKKHEIDYGIDLKLYKSMPTQTGLGSSAASSVAAAKAIYEILGPTSFSEEQKLHAALAGDLAVTGDYFLDNIVPSFVGGVNIFARVSTRDETPTVRRARIVNHNFFTVAFLFNGEKLDTQSQRERTTRWIMNQFKEGPDGTEEGRVGKLLKLLTFQSGGAGLLLDGLVRGDLKLVGEIITSSSDNFLLDSRKESIPRFDELKRTMMNGGALSTAISGSGPAVFGIVQSLRAAEGVRDAVLRHFHKEQVKWLISDLNVQGAQIVNNREGFMEVHRKYHNFW